MTARAAIDIGTNSVRLLVVDATRDLERRAVITRLGQGVDRNGELSDSASSSSTSDSPAASPAMRAPSASSIGTSGIPNTSR